MKEQKLRRHRGRHSDGVQEDWEQHLAAPGAYSAPWARGPITRHAPGGARGPLSWLQVGAGATASQPWAREARGGRRVLTAGAGLIARRPDLAALGGPDGGYTGSMGVWNVVVLQDQGTLGTCQRARGRGDDGCLLGASHGCSALTPRLPAADESAEAQEGFSSLEAHLMPPGRRSGARTLSQGPPSQ